MTKQAKLRTEQMSSTANCRENQQKEKHIKRNINNVEKNYRNDRKHDSK